MEKSRKQQSHNLASVHTFDETICQLVLRKPVVHVNLDVDVDELVQDKRGLATYEQIKAYVLEHSGLKVSSLYIAQVKQKCGIIERENYNKPKSEDTKQPPCPSEKEKAIGRFTITLYDGGTFTYYEGMASSYIGIGSWEQNGDSITLTDDGHGGYRLVNHFKLDGDDLMFVEQDSDNFVYVKVKNEEYFYCTGEAFKQDNGADSPVQNMPSRKLSLNDVIILSKKGYDLTWSDFEQYQYIETGSGLYIRVYEINEMYQLWIGGAGPDSDPMYIYLALADDFDTRIDIRDAA